MRSTVPERAFYHTFATSLAALVAAVRMTRALARQRDLWVVVLEAA
jgi:hypothetical protein